MMHKSFFLLLIGLVFIGECVSSGKFISIKEAPYYVSLIFGNESFCGGSIISEHWVITAGHCTDKSVIDITNVRTGVSSQFKNGMMYGIEKVIVHGDYEISDKCSYDVALIKLKDPITFSEFQQPIKLRSKRPSTGENVILSGLGSQGNAPGETIILKQVVILVTEQYTCDPSPEIYNEDVFCAGGNGFDACPSDSGGPAVIDDELAGLVSYKPECAYQPPEKSGAYQRIDLHLNWIFKHTGIH